MILLQNRMKRVKKSGEKAEVRGDEMAVLNGGSFA